MIGAHLGVRYELTEETEGTPIFDGFKATEKPSGREVRIRVVKDPYRLEPTFVQALRQHADQLRAVNHGSIERVLGFEQEEGIPFLVTEVAPGVTLEERVRRLASFSVPMAVATAIGVVEGLNALHQAGIVHGDVSAKNVVVPTSGSVRLVLPGFWETYRSSSKAGLAMLRGMAPYIAPEVTSGEMPSARSDIYAVGVLLYQMLAGRLPFPGDTAASIAEKHSSSPVPSVRTANPAVPAAMDEIVHKAMSKSPHDRYPDAAALLADLRLLQDALRFGRPVSWPLQGGPVEPERVVPELNAVEQAKAPAPAPNPRKRPPADQDGVPKWLSAIVYLATATVVVLIGVFVFFNLQKPKLVDLPNVIGMTASEAEKQLGDMGLQMSVLREETSERQPRGVVLDQRPLPGKNKIKENGYVEVVVSSGGKFVEVPDLRGRSIEEARQLLQSLDLNVADDVERVRDEDLDAGLVVRHVPEARKKIERFTRVRLVVSNGNEPVNAPGGRSGTYTYSLDVTMPAGDVPILVQIDMTDERGTETVHSEEHVGGDKFTVEADGRGEEVMFRIFFDGELVKQVTKKASEAVADPPEEQR